jgi:hypothetical protein
MGGEKNLCKISATNGLPVLKPIKPMLKENEVVGAVYATSS